MVISSSTYIHNKPAINWLMFTRYIEILYDKLAMILSATASSIQISRTFTSINKHIWQLTNSCFPRYGHIASISDDDIAFFTISQRLGYVLWTNWQWFCFGIDPGFASLRRMRFLIWASGSSSNSFALFELLPDCPHLSPRIQAWLWYSVVHFESTD